ncbi:hypothetical protein CKO15_08045 [Halorhodospira abdelmalekii]|uniref:ABC transporter substrate-binding protein n=1 Tax=Halorhodospira abdelmalekii TaxID=421629 RepID=UPI00190671FA|nr:ABC transporter substrate-binding protein [Halorhodospira abdelmalekii]MBK1735236.1 hypothetical protein [Halorhodospira abdelmalekii]
MFINARFIHKCFFLLLSILLLVSLLGCGAEDPAEQRAQKVVEEEQKLIVGLAWPFEGPQGEMREGARLAQEKLNDAGGVLGREIQFLEFDDKSEVDRAMIFAQRVADDPSVAAVIAHLDTFLAVPASSVYEAAGVLMISPGATGMPLTERGLKMVFRTHPSNLQQAEALAELARERGYNRIVIYYVNNPYGIDLANFFERRASEFGVEVVDRRAYDFGSDHRRIFRNWLRYQEFQPFDAVFLAGSLPAAAEIIREARKMGHTVPIFGGDGLDSEILIGLGGEYSEGVITTSVFNKALPDSRVQNFVAAYEDRYGLSPSSFAAQGYDAVMLLADAAEKAGSVDPRDIAAELRGSDQRWPEPWVGVTGSHAFSEGGEIVGKPVVFNLVDGGAFYPLRRFVGQNSDQ